MRFQEEEDRWRKSICRGLYHSFSLIKAYSLLKIGFVADNAHLSWYLGDLFIAVTILLIIEPFKWNPPTNKSEQFPISSLPGMILIELGLSMPRKPEPSSTLSSKNFMEEDRWPNKKLPSSYKMSTFRRTAKSKRRNYTRSPKKWWALEADHRMIIQKLFKYTSI